PRKQGEPPKAVEQGGNLGEIDADYAKDNMEITDKENQPTMPTFHRKGKSSTVTYNRPLAGQNEKNKLKENSKKEKKVTKANLKKDKGKLLAAGETKACKLPTAGSTQASISSSDIRHMNSVS
ncbi:hypothetical protein U1Q18_028558, partial [Sarracenia purpurea var. burkii]